MNYFLNPRQIFSKTSLIAFSLISKSLLATTYVSVSDDNGSGVEGTLSWAINQVNNTNSGYTSPIVINSGISPYLSGNMPNITTSLTIESEEVNSATNTIQANDYTALSLTTGTTTIESNIALTLAIVSIDGASLVFQVNSWDGINSMYLTNGTINFSNIESNEYSGSISISSSATISGCNFLIQGQISESTLESNLTFNNGEIGLKNTASSNLWTGGTSLLSSNLTIYNSNSFPAAGTTQIDSNSLLSFNLPSSDTYTGFGDFNFTPPSSETTTIPTITISTGSVNLSGNITGYNISETTSPYIIMNGTKLIMSGEISDVYLNSYNGTTVLTNSNNSFLSIALLSENSNPILEIFSINNIGNSTSLTIEGGTLHSTSDVTFNTSQSVFLSASYGGTFNTDSGATLTIPVLTISGFGDSTLTLTGDGTNGIDEFFLNAPTKESFLTISGSLGGSNGLTTTSELNSTLTLILVSPNTFTGPTTIQESTELQVNSGASFGNSSDHVTINSKGTLYVNSGGSATASTFINNGTIIGCGTLNGTVVNNKVTTTGCSCSFLNVNGDFVSNSGSTINVFLKPECTSGLNITEELTLENGTTLQINPESGCYSKNSASYEIITAQSLTGTFEYLSIGSILLNPSLTYYPNKIVLNIVPELLSNIVTSGNAGNVAVAIDKILESGNSKFCKTIGTFIPLTDAEITAALDEMHPAQFKAFAVAQENNAVKVIDTLNFRFQRELDKIHCKNAPKNQKPCQLNTKTFHSWIGGFGDTLHQKNVSFADSPQAGYQENMGGAVAGIDYHFTQYLYAGALGAYTDSNLTWQKNRGKGSIQTGYAGLYFSALGDMFYGNASILGGWSCYNAHRNINLTENKFKANSNHKGSQLLSHIDTGVNLGWGAFTIRPFDSFDYITQTENSFSESGAENLNLFIHKNNSIMLRNELGLNFASCFCLKGGKWTLSPKISWVREVRVKGAEYTSNFVGTTEDFTITGFFPDRSLVSPGVSLIGNILQDLLTFGLYYNGEFKGNYSDHSFGGEMRFGF